MNGALIVQLRQRSVEGREAAASGTAGQEGAERLDVEEIAALDSLQRRAQALGLRSSARSSRVRFSDVTGIPSIVVRSRGSSLRVAWQRIPSILCVPGAVTSIMPAGAFRSSHSAAAAW